MLGLGGLEGRGQTPGAGDEGLCARAGGAHEGWGQHADSDAVQLSPI